jgi:hypothetical protein
LIEIVNRGVTEEIVKAAECAHNFLLVLHENPDFRANAFVKEFFQ